MTTLEIILSITSYVLLALVSYKPFKRGSENNHFDHPIAATFIAPLFWMMLLILAIVIGFEKIFKKNK